MIQKTCLNCQTKFDQNSPRQKFCTESCRTANNYNSWSNSRKKRGIQRKQKLIDISGGGCTKCGYNKCFRALTFHHINPNDKKFTLDQSNLYKYSWNKIYQEFQKCILLCQNCHAILHEIERLNKSDISSSYHKKYLLAYNRKQKLIKELGGKCNHCQLQSNFLQCFSFHHLRDKKFDINMLTLRSNFSKCKNEAKKCELLCLNCHMEHHDSIS